jgi:hypothetical protein
MADFEALAKQFGGAVAPAPKSATTANVDYDSLAKQFGGAVSTPPKGTVSMMGTDGVPVGRQRSWLDVPVEAIANVVPSAINMASGVYEAVTSPVQTIKSLGDVAAGAVYNVLPKEVVSFIDKFDSNPANKQRAIEMANAVGGVYKDRYGSEEAIKKTIATDPVGFAGDLSTLLTGGAMVAGRVAPTVSNALATGARYTNPMNAITPIVKAPFVVGAKGVDFGRKVLNPKVNALISNIEGKGPEILNALRAPEQFVAGVAPTAGELVATTGSTLYPALQKSVLERIPSKALERKNINLEAIKEQLGTVAKGADELDIATAARTAATDPLYEAIRTAGNVVDPQKVTAIKSFIDDTISKKPGNTELVNEFSKISKQLVDETGNARIDAGQVSSILDGLKTSLAKEDNKFIRGELSKVKKQLVDVIPGYAAADAKFAEMSQPINKMQVGQYLETKLIPALEGKANLKPEAFVAALKDAPTTIRQSTGMPRYQSLAQMFTPDELQIFDGITKELRRTAKFEEAAAFGKEAGAVLPAAKIEKINLMNRVASVANLIMSKVQGKITEKMAIELAVEMLDPALAAKSIEKALAHQKKTEKFLINPARMVSKAADITRTQPAVAAGQLTNALAPQQQNQNALAR